MIYRRVTCRSFDFNGLTRVLQIWCMALAYRKTLLCLQVVADHFLQRRFWTMASRLTSA